MASTYRRPGVYITEIPNPAVAGLPSGFRLPGLVGTGKTTLPVLNTPVVKGVSNGTDAIPVGPYSLVTITQIGDNPSLKQYIQGVDWNQVGSSITWINGGQQPTTGATYYVSWTRAKVSTDYLPTLYTSLQDVRNAYGNELEAGVTYCIPVAARMLFDNGAPSIVITQALTAAQSDLQTAIDNMTTQDIDVLLVPQATNTTLTNYVRAHVMNQSSPAVQHERWYITSADGNSDAITTIAGKATSMSLDRMWIVAPPSFAMTLHDAVYLTDEQLLLPSTYLAAQVAGTATNPNFDPAAPLTRRSVVDADNLSTFNYSETQKDYLGAAGVMVIESAAGGIRIRHGLTTDTTNVNTVTASVLLIKDNIRKTLRTLLDKQYIGTKILASTPSSVSTTISTFLKGKIADQIIVSYRNITVVQDTIDPRTINVSFDIQPSYELDYLDVSFSLFTA